MDNYSSTSFQGLRRTGAVFTQLYLAGLNPLVGSLSNPCIRTRFLIATERLRQERCDQISTEAKQLRALLNESTRRERALKIGNHIFLLISRITAQDLHLEIEKRKQDNKNLKADSVKHASELTKVTLKVSELERHLHEASQQLIRARTERDEAFSGLQMEQRKRQAEQHHRSIAISSLRSRFQSEKAKLGDEIRALQYKIRNQELDIKDMQSHAHESVQDIEKLESTITRLEQNEMVSHVSQHLTNVLADISAVVLVRPANQQTVEQKIKEIRECTRNIVTELQSRRRNAVGWQDRVFALEEEKKLWICNESRHEVGFRRLQKSLVAAKREIAARKAQQGPDSN